MNSIYLSYILNHNTPTYGNRNRFVCEKKSDISKNDIANDSFMSTTVHIGTHIDMPYHFFEDGQTIEKFDADFFRFDHVLFISIQPLNFIIKEELLSKLETILEKEKYTLLIVKTGICYKRDEKEFWDSNYGFDPSIADYIRKNFPNVRVFGFDSISVASFTDRMIGREAHRAFLNPDDPILLLEDMNLQKVDETTKFKSIHIAPMRIAECDGLPCTVIAEII